MKRNLTLMVGLFVAFFMFACGKDNKNEESTNPFVGTWALESYVANGVDKTTDCGRKETVVFTDNEITINSYYVRQYDGACVSEVIKLTYTFSNGKVSNITTQDGTVLENSEESESSFAIVNGKLILTEIDGNSKVVTTYKKQ